MKKMKRGNNQTPPRGSMGFRIGGTSNVETAKAQEPAAAPRAAVEDPDSLRSKAYARVLDLLCEGEIEGLVDGYKSVYLDDTVVQNPNGSFNFNVTDSTIVTRYGTQDQSHISGFPAVENEVAVGEEITKDGSGPHIFAVTNQNANAVIVKILVPQLSETNAETGDTKATRVELTVQVQPDGGSYGAATWIIIRGKSSNRYERSHRVPLDGDGPWNVKITRVTDDSASGLLRNRTYLQSYTEVVNSKLRYPNSALVGLRFDAQQFRTVPSRAYDVKLLKIQIPSNYNPTTRAYTGSWDGTFTTAWSDNPAWVFYDLATNERYGLGAFISEDKVDKWALYEIAQYCDELVDNGFGGTEPRFTCNLMLQNRAEAYSVMQGLASVFRGMIYWAAGSVTVVQDSPQDAVQLFTPANVVDGRFVYQGASLKARHSVALVTWNDPDDMYRPKVEYVEDQEAISRFGVVQTEVLAVGCTSRGQANRLGRWLLYTEQYESELVTFATGLDGLLVRPGQIIKIADPVRAGSRLGGRISEATTTTVTIDQDISGSISGGALSAMLPDGTVEERTVVGQAERVITVQPAFSSAPNSQSIWMLQTAAVEPQTFRVLAVSEDANSTFKVTAIKHLPDKFAAVEEGLELEERSYSNITGTPDAPTNVTITESLYQSTTEVRAKLTVSWDPVDTATGYTIRYKRDDENFIETESSFNEKDILDVQPGTYTVHVAAVNAIGRRSASSSASREIFGKTAAPSDVDGFSMIPSAGQALLTWTQATDLDVLVGGKVRLRHTPLISGQVWSDSIDIVPAVPGTATSAIAPLLAGTYMAKFIDSSGNYSETAASIITSIPEIDALNVVETLTEHPAYTGTKTDMAIDTLTGYLVLSDGLLWDDLGLIDDLTSIDFPGDISPTGTYDFSSEVDLGGKWPARIRGKIDLEAFDIAAVIDNRVSLMDTWSDVDGDNVNDVDAQLYVRTTDDDPGATPTWGDWRRIHSGEYEARAFQFQLRCTSGSEFHTLYIRQLEVVVDMADRTTQQGPLTSGAGTYSVNYGFGFREAPAIGITAGDLQTGDYYEITNADEDGFDIVFKNSAGVAVSRTFYVIAKGYGRKVA